MERRKDTVNIESPYRLIAFRGYYEGVSFREYVWLNKYRVGR